MSRNLGQTNCYYCPGEIKLVESPRTITKEEMGGYSQFTEMIVANAECATCAAKYLAWIEIPGDTYLTRRPNDTREFSDLSFRSTFNDEPGEDDLPDVIVSRWPHRCLACDKKVPEYRSVCDKCNALVSAVGEVIDRTKAAAALLRQHPETAKQIESAVRLGADKDALKKLVEELFNTTAP